MSQTHAIPSARAQDAETLRRLTESIGRLKAEEALIWDLRNMECPVTGAPRDEDQLQAFDDALSHLEDVLFYLNEALGQ